MLQDHVMSFTPFIRSHFHLTNDNALPYIARMVTDYLSVMDALVLEWHPRNPDYSSIEPL